MSLSGIENGSRIRFDHPSAKGLAGLVEYNGRISLAYRRTSDREPSIGAELDLGESGRFIVETARTDRAQRMVTLGLSRITGGNE